MDPSSGRDRNPNANANSTPNPTADANSHSHPENPFIRFKNFADAQVSSLLQGVIGLPSALSKPSSENNRWADMDEDLRRRDQLQARQQLVRQQMGDAEARKSNGSLGNVEVEIPVRKTSQQQRLPASEKPRAQEASMESAARPESEYDLPLYAPVTDELFSNLRRPDPLLKLAGGEFLTEWAPFNFLGIEKCSSDPLESTRQIAFNALAHNFELRSDYSLLPYLLFSPYSPIKLDGKASSSSWGGLEKYNGFTYCAAFEDLIRTTQGKKNIIPTERRNWMSQPALQTGASGLHNWHWIMGLYAQGILQQKHPMPFPSSPLPLGLLWKIIDGQEGTPATELEWLEHIFSRILTDTEGRDVTSNPFSTADRSLIREDKTTRLHDMIAQARERARAAQEGQITSLPKQALTDQDERTPRTAPITDRVVSTSTTTERFTHEDGTVETCVTMWKRFGDGRETTTTTTHTEDPGWEDKDQPSWPVEATTKAPGEKETEEKGERKEQKRGWFWN